MEGFLMFSVSKIISVKEFVVCVRKIYAWRNVSFIMKNIVPFKDKR